MRWPVSGSTQLFGDGCCACADAVTVMPKQAVTTAGTNLLKFILNLL
jgi:hypothetical protein